MQQTSCPRCHHPVQPGWKLCPNCGQMLLSPVNAQLSQQHAVAQPLKVTRVLAYLVAGFFALVGLLFLLVAIVSPSIRPFAFGVILVLVVFGVLIANPRRITSHLPGFRSDKLLNVAGAWSVVGAGSLVVLVIAVLLSASSSTPAASAPATATTIPPSPQIALVAQPVPATSTPLLPTATPLPTNTPAPAATNTPQLPPTATPIPPTATSVPPTATPVYSFKPTDFEIYPDADTNIMPGNWAALRFKVTNTAPVAASSIQIVISSDLFDAFTLKSTEPGVTADHVENDGRHFDFGPLGAGETVVYTFNMVAKSNSSPSSWQAAIYYNRTHPINTYYPKGLVITPPTPTPVPTLTRAQMNEQYPVVDIRDLKKNPDSYKGERFRLTGTVFNIQQSGLHTVLQIWVQVPGGSEFDREAVVVDFQNSTPGLYNDAPVIVYGIGAGTWSGTNALGGKITQPLVSADYLRW